MKKFAVILVPGLVLLGALAVGGSPIAGHVPVLWGGSEPAPEASTSPSFSATPGGAPAPQRAFPSFSEVAASASPAVVNISTTTTVEAPDFGGRSGPFRRRGPSGEEDPFEEFFRRFQPPEMPRNFKRRSLGSGFIISPDGTIVTNHHVVDGADEIIVRLSGKDGEYKAKRVGSDEKTDIAIVRIEPQQKDLPTLGLGDSQALQVGEWVIAIGNPFGLDHTVTAGIVSARGRVIGQGPYDDFIQTDASINPGNSGGPLLNLAGEVVGINTAIFSQSGGNIGIGFAIPSHLAREVIGQLRDKGRVVRGWLGVMIQNVSEDLARSFGLTEPRGALVADVEKDGPAAKAGIRRGDVIVTFEGKSVESARELPSIVAATAIGKKAEVELLRDGKKRTLAVEVREMPGATVAKGKPGRAGETLGLRLAPVTAEVAKSLGVPAGSGLVVEAVRGGSAAEEAGIEPGDVIEQVDRKPVSSVADFRGAVRGARGKEHLLLLVRRRDATLFLTMKLAS